jgi:hypothetical protein
MASMRGPKSSAPVVVDVPGSVTFERFSMTDASSSVVEPSSVSWKGIAMTAIDSSSDGAEFRRQPEKK